MIGDGENKSVKSHDMRFKLLTDRHQCFLSTLIKFQWCINGFLSMLTKRWGGNLKYQNAIFNTSKSISVDFICWSDLYQIRSMGSNTELDMPSILKASKIWSGSEKEKLVKSQSSWLMAQLAVCELLLLDYDHYNMFVRHICILYRIANTSADRYHLSTISKDFQIESPNSSAINGWPTNHMDNKWLEIELKGNENTHLQLKYISLHSLDLRDIKTSSHCLPCILAKQRPSKVQHSQVQHDQVQHDQVQHGQVQHGQVQHGQIWLKTAGSASLQRGTTSSKRSTSSNNLGSSGSNRSICWGITIILITIIITITINVLGYHSKFHVSPAGAEVSWSSSLPSLLYHHQCAGVPFVMACFFITPSPPKKGNHPGWLYVWQVIDVGSETTQAAIIEEETLPPFTPAEGSPFQVVTYLGVSLKGPS